MSDLKGDQLIAVLGDAVAAEWEKLFPNTTLDNRVRRRLAASVIEQLDAMGASTYQIEGIVNGDLSTCDGYCHEFCG